MTTYKKIEIPCGVPDLNWFSDLEVPTFNTAKFVGFEIRDCDSIIYTNNLGQVVNVVRATGTDYINADKIKNNIEVKGIQIDSLPPVILEDGTSIDGFTRGYALKSLGQNKWVYTVVKLEDGYELEDLKDELGLGCNDHPPSKAADIKDFKVRLANWIDRYQKRNSDKLPTLDQCLDWWASIRHSIKEEKVKSACEDVLNKIRTKSSMSSLKKEEAESKARKMLECDNQTEVIAINNKRSTYIERAFIQALNAISDNKNVKVVGFLSDVPAEEAKKARQQLKKDVQKLNKMFRNYAQKYNDDVINDLITIEGFIPQILDEEDATELVRIS